MQDLRHELRTFIVDNFLFGQQTAHAPFSDEESLLDLGIIDSTGILELVMFVETHCSITIADDELSPENLDSVSRLVDFIARKRSIIVRNLAAAESVA
jgi:acyl carrier protein